jgi:hypothetical protein
MHGTLSHLPLPRYSSILAFDLGKFNSVLCRFDPATAGHSFVSLATTREAIARELEPVPIADRSNTLVVFETCDISGWVYDLISSMGFAIAVANPATEAWRWTKIKRKTDHDDALKLAKLASGNSKGGNSKGSGVFDAVGLNWPRSLAGRIGRSSLQSAVCLRH